MCTQHSLLLWRARQDRASQASKGPLFCVIEGRTNYFDGSATAMAKASSGAASGATAIAWCCAEPPLKSKLVAFSFSKPVLCSCALHSVPVAILYSFLHVARCEPRAVAFAV